MRSRIQKLLQVHLLFDRTPSTSEENYGEDEDEAKVPAVVKQARQLLKDDISRRLFPYTTLDDKYGMLFQDDNENLTAFQGGKDQASYEKLTAKIKAKAERFEGK